jgi:hypothetical protein
MTLEEDLDARADAAYNALHGIDAGIHGTAMAPAEVHAVIGSLKRTPHLLPGILKHLAECLAAAADSYELEDTHTQPDQSALGEYVKVPDPAAVAAASINTSANHLLRAAKLSAQIGLELEQAQTALASVTHRSRPAGAATVTG